MSVSVCLYLQISLWRSISFADFFALCGVPLALQVTLLLLVKQAQV